MNNLLIWEPKMRNTIKNFKNTLIINKLINNLLIWEPKIVLAIVG